MNDNKFTVNSIQSLQAFLAMLPGLFEQHKYITFSWRIGKARSLDQNALAHVFFTEYAAHLLRKDKRDVTKGEVEGMKRHAKREYYRETGYPWLIHTVVNPATGQTKKDFTSSKSWKKGEMMDFLSWLQMKAANDGLILESKGEYAENLRKQNQ